MVESSVSMLCSWELKKDEISKYGGIAEGHVGWSHNSRNLEFSGERRWWRCLLLYTQLHLIGRSVCSKPHVFSDHFQYVALSARILSCSTCSILYGCVAFDDGRVTFLSTCSSPTHRHPIALCLETCSTSALWLFVQPSSIFCNMTFSDSENQRMYEM